VILYANSRDTGDKITHNILRLLPENTTKTRSRATTGIFLLFRTCFEAAPICAPMPTRFCCSSLLESLGMLEHRCRFCSSIQARGRPEQSMLVCNTKVGGGVMCGDEKNVQHWDGGSAGWKPYDVATRWWQNSKARLPPSSTVGRGLHGYGGSSVSQVEDRPGLFQDGVAAEQMSLQLWGGFGHAAIAGAISHNRSRWVGHAKSLDFRFSYFSRLDFHFSFLFFSNYLLIYLNTSLGPRRHYMVSLRLPMLPPISGDILRSVAYV
jgi:hypothetical protein